jgi:hypothetical protein
MDILFGLAFFGMLVAFGVVNYRCTIKHANHLAEDLKHSI